MSKFITAKKAKSQMEIGSKERVDDFLKKANDDIVEKSKLGCSFTKLHITLNKYEREEVMEKLESYGYNTSYDNYWCDLTISW